MEQAKQPVENVIALWIAECKGFTEFDAWDVQGACELLDRLDEAGFEVWSKALPKGLPKSDEEWRALTLDWEDGAA